MNTSSLLAKKYVLAFLLLLVVKAAQPQNLPNVQKNPVYLTGIKIDGQALELKDKFQSYNKAIDAYYTLSNDENNLYLTFRVVYNEIISKLLLGGVTLTVNHSKVKRDTAAVSITFPFLENEDRGRVANMFTESTNKKREIGESVFSVAELNAILKSATKKIKVEGLPGLKAAAISIYNEQAIKVAAMFDGQLRYTYELALPLNLLGLPNKGDDVFSYQLRINSPLNNEKLKQGAGAPAPPMMLSTIEPTYFWAEFKLVKI